MRLLLLAAPVATLGACASEPLGPESSAEDECSELPDRTWSVVLVCQDDIAY